MNIIAHISQEIAETLPNGVYWLNYYIKNNENNPVDGGIFLTLGLPTPTIITYYNRGSISYAWALEGYFGGEKQRQFLIDIKDKIGALFAFNDITYQDIGFNRPEMSQNARYNGIIYKPHAFSNIEDRRKKTIKRKWAVQLSHALVENGKKSLIDQVFELSRFKIYALKKDGRLNYDNVFYILDDTNRVYYQNKCSYSDIKSKAKNMLAWTEENVTVGLIDKKNYNLYHRDYERNKYKENKKINTGEEVMTRTEAIKIATKIKMERAKATVFATAEMMKLQGTLYKKNGNPCVSDVSKLAKISLDTTKKYLLEGGYYLIE